ncbi:astacin-like metalloendopeptidase isoform X3 [Simochromis diagramma]|uniref:astacin-like metalloendopeptidase isoform X3 n=1 Tax=Simochromis diagramma TaxID=43689 RepID=UPI001A7E9273|nr:astacin-like metalloendopeptidase isoform X3 [Simochromis diagramma]
MPCCIMWLLAAFCLSTVGSVPISPVGPFAGNVSLNATTTGGYESTTAATPRDYAFSLNPTINTTSSAPVGATPLNDALNASSLAEDHHIFLENTLNATSSVPAPLNDALNASSLAEHDAIYLNDTFNTISSAPGGATPLNYALNITSLAEVGLVGPRFLTDALNATSPAAGYATSFNDTHITSNTTGSVPGAAAPEPESSKNKSAETLKEFDQDMPVQEGDILIPENRNAVHTLWPDATTSYIITDELVSREAEIKAAFKMISDVTCIRFKKRDTESSYLKLVTGNGCASFVGCQGGAQQLFFASECTVGNLCHELLHALGLYHEHTREDRDKYVIVNWQNIVAGKENNFKVKHGNTQNLPYDLTSIMHYGRDFFSTNGNPTVLPKQSGVEIGQRKHLSQLDIKRLNKLYGCGKL